MISRLPGWPLTIRLQVFFKINLASSGLSIFDASKAKATALASSPKSGFALCKARKAFSCLTVIGNDINPL